ncbi:MAG: CapA family protein [Candidatus Aquicultorales bacterium]
MPEKRTIAFVGDVMLGRGVNREIPLFPPDYFWGDTLPLLNSAETVVANLECAVTSQEIEWARTPKVFVFRADPEAIDLLKAANIGCVCLANNHSLDAEEEGLLDTLRLLNEAGIKHAGAGRNLAEARKPAIFDIDGSTVGMIAVTDNEPAFSADEERPGTNYRGISADPATLRYLQEDIDAARRAGAEFIILSLHWGPNMVISPPDDFREFARTALDRGVDMIHGHSAHIFQGVERYKGGLIMYDTGDFIDDYAVDPFLRNDWSFIFMVDVSGGRIERLRMIPVFLSEAQVNLAKGTEFDAILDRMTLLCDEFGTPLNRTDEGLEVPG